MPAAALGDAGSRAWPQTEGRQQVADRQQERPGVLTPLLSLVPPPRLQHRKWCPSRPFHQSNNSEAPRASRLRPPGLSTPAALRRRPARDGDCQKLSGAEVCFAPICSVASALHRGAVCKLSWLSRSLRHVSTDHHMFHVGQGLV